MTEPTPPPAPIIDKPTTNWEHLGGQALDNVNEVLFQQYMKLSPAASHYLDSYQGDNLSGVASTLDAAIKNTADVFSHTAGKDEIVNHIVESANTLTSRVQAQLDEMRQYADITLFSPFNLTVIVDNTVASLKALLAEKDLYMFNRLAEDLASQTQQGVNLIRNMATSEQTAPKEVTRLADEESQNFDDWWKDHYLPGYPETVPGYQQSLRVLWETAQQRGDIIQDVAGRALNEVPEDIADPVTQFIEDFRQFRFPGSQPTT